MPHEPAGRPQTPGEARDGVGAPLLTTAAVCALLGVQRHALARYYATQAEEARKKAATAMDEALRREAK